MPLQHRVAVLPKVLAATARGDAALDAGNVATARSAYAAALALDEQYAPPRTALAQLTTQAAQRNYLAVMSQGYSALQRQAFDAARVAFEKAQTLHPDRQAAVVAMQDLAGKRTTSTLAQLEADSARFAAEERFADAIKAYEQALAIDASLAFAKRGIVVAKERQQLQQALNNALAHPERQSSDDTRNATLALRARVAAVADKGQRLQTQLAALDALLLRSAAPINVTLQSDNITEVRLYRLGALGRFAQKQVALRPGRYVATGVRDGFRDARVEFDVAPNMASVMVRCDESIR